MEDLISVIVPIYNVEKYINKCIDSIINQTYTNLEIILVDDGSPDNCGKICDEYAEKDNRIKVIHKENGGVSSARNIGLDEASGKYITFIDSDDWINENFCKIMIDIMKKWNPDCVVCKCNKVYKEEISKINLNKLGIKNINEEFLIKVLNVQNGFGFCHSKLIKKEKIGNIRFDQQLKVGEDALFNIILAKRLENVILVEENIYNYRINNESVVRKYDEDYLNKYMLSIKKIKEYIIKEYSHDIEIQRNLYNYIMYHIFLIIVNYCCNSNNNLNFFKQYTLIKEICNIEEFKLSIKKANYNELSITRKVTLFTLKYKLYILTTFIGKIRNYQIKRG